MAFISPGLEETPEDMARFAREVMPRVGGPAGPG